MKIYIGADHNGFAMKSQVVNYLRKNGYEVIDEGDKVLKPTDDFPVFASKVVWSLLGDHDPDSKGILLCGSGQGMVMAANRFKGIRASLVWDLLEAKLSRNDDDSNILCLPTRLLGKENTESIIDGWLTTPFSGAPRYVRRIKELDKLG